MKLLKLLKKRAVKLIYFFYGYNNELQSKTV